MFSARIFVLQFARFGVGSIERLLKIGTEESIR